MYFVRSKMTRLNLHGDLYSKPPHRGVQPEHRWDSNQGSDYIAIFLSLISFFWGTTLENLKCIIGGEFIFLSKSTFKFGLHNTQNNFIQIIVISKFFPHCILLSLIFEILLKFNWYLNLQLDKNMNSPPIAHCRFPNVLLRKEKSKKERWQCSQNLELNLTYGEEFLVLFPSSDVQFWGTNIKIGTCSPLFYRCHYVGCHFVFIFICTTRIFGIYENAKKASTA